MPTRRYQRVSMQRPVNLRSTGPNHSGVTLDFSPEGCAIQQNKLSLHCGMRLKLQLTLPDRPEGLDVEQAIVAWATQHSCGIRFMTISPAGHMRIKSVYDSLLDAQTGEGQEEPPALISLQAIIPG